MQLQEIDAQGGNNRRHSQNLFPALPGKPENEVGTKVDSPIAGSSDPVEPAPVVVPPIDPSERSIVNRFQTVFESYEVSPRKLFKPSQFRVIDTVGTGPHGQTDDFGMIKRRLVHRHEPFERSVGICKGLKVNNKLPGAVSAPQVVHSILHLLPDRFQSVDRFGTKGVVVAVGAASYGHRS